MTGKERARFLRPQALPLWLGLVPLFMFLLFGLRSGTGLNLPVLVLAALGLLGFGVSLGYHFFCRAALPRVVIQPMGHLRGSLVALAMLPLVLVNSWGIQSNRSLTLSPGGLVSPMDWIMTAANLALARPAPPPTRAIGALSQALFGGPFMGGALWGALGYAVAFAIAGGCFALLRQEAFDPRQEPFGGAGSWPMLRPLIGYFYGLSLGFLFGAVLIWLASTIFLRIEVLPPAIEAMLTAFGVVREPNLAFTHAFSAGGLIMGFSTLFLGRADFTAPFSDPKRAEREPDMKIKIPELPKTPPPEFDFASIGFETEQIATQFQAQLGELARQLGFADPIEPAAELLKDGRAEEQTEGPKEPPVANLISARRPDFDLSFDSAMGQLSNVYVQVSAQLGSTELPLTDWLMMGEGSILELPRPKDNHVVLTINGRPVGKGRAVMVEDHKAIKVLALSPDATKNLGR